MSISRLDPMIIAHRGLAGHAPENTLAAYGAALILRFGFEADLTSTRDREIVMIHDPTLERTTTGQGIVEEKELNDIRLLDAGSWFHPSYAGELVPTFSETCQMIAQHRHQAPLIGLHFKSGSPETEAAAYRTIQEHGLIDSVLVLAIETGREGRCQRERFRSLDQHIMTAVRLDTSRELEIAISDNTADWLYLRFIPLEDHVTYAHAHGKSVLKGGPLPDEDAPGIWRYLHRIGIDAIMTDYPLECREAIEGEIQ